MIESFVVGPDAPAPVAQAAHDDARSARGAQPNALRIAA
jgi:hypothetical protein